MTTDFIYDHVPYPSYTFGQTHPDRLTTVAAFNGLRSAEPERCRVLELGCGDGTNLLWFASTLPDSEFVGVDLSIHHIQDAKAGVEALGFDNIAFHQEDIMGFSRDRFGEFDYIIAHGLFSWVPEIVRQKLLEIYAECLTPLGVGYISYNAYPGSHIRRMVAEMMRFHADRFQDPMEKVRQGRAIIKFFAEGTQDNNIYQKVLQDECALIDERHDLGIFHDDLSEINDAFYFLEFIGKIGPHGLQYLGEAKSSSEHSSSLTPQAVETVNGLGDDTLRREQYLDFLIGRRFRSTLVCRDDLKLDRKPKPDIINDVFIVSHLTPASDGIDVASTSSARFEGKGGTAVETNHPLTKAVLITLHKRKDEETKFQPLVQECIKLVGNLDPAALENETTRTAQFLIEMYKAGYVYLRRRRSRFATEAGEFPEASPFVRWQVSRKSPSLRTLFDTNIRPEGNYVFDLLTLLDGTRDRAALANEMTRVLEKTGEKRADFERDLPQGISTVLSQLAAAGLLIK